jgi:hypothetical protein
MLMRVMERLDEAVNGRRHNDQVSGRPWRRVPEGMRRSAWHDHATARGNIDLALIDPEGQNAFEHVPGFIVTIVDVQRGDERWRVGAATPIDHFGQDQVGPRRSDGPTRQRGEVKVFGD